MSSEDINAIIETNAASPRKVETDGGSVEARDLRELIEAEKHIAAKTAANSSHFGLRRKRQVPPGAF